MSDSENELSPGNESLLKRIQSLEARLSNIESILRLEWTGDTDSGVPSDIPTTHDEKMVESTESRIVVYGLAWLGSIVFVFGIVFLMSYLESLGFPVLSKVAAYFSASLLIAFAYLMRHSFPILVNVLNVFSPLLIYYITLKLHFFSEQPLIQSMGLAIVLLFTVIGFQLNYALRRKSEIRGVIAITLCVLTAIICDSTYATFLILTITAIVSHLLFYNKVWWRLHIFSLFIIYIAHLLWLFSNPVMGHAMKVVDSPDFNLLFLFGYAIIFSISIFLPKSRLESNGPLISITIWNALGFSLLLMMIIPSFYVENYALIFGAIAAYCLLFSVILKLKANRNFAPATYASFGFAALSIAVYGLTGFPDAYFLLVLQSLLVVSIALWFRSQIIVVANALLFISILLFYLVASESIDLINFAFAFAALATARILGWQKVRLTLKTDIFRNAYLIIASLMILYSLNQALPSQYVTFAWTAMAIGFFILSILLRNIKYRYLSIFTIVVTGGHLFFVDLGQMEIGYRVIAFLVFALISIAVSLYYTKRIRKD